MNVLDMVEKQQLRTDIPEFKPGDTVKVHWECDYKFAGRPVHNVLDTTLVIKDGKVAKQTDQWDWAKWSQQALPLGDTAGNGGNGGGSGCGCARNCINRPTDR